ncbi:MAG TPA: translocation and assembly module protein TamB [Maritimibacter sp.]|nr:translocation and assembly module protein TamB [Maritimibacter sp.]
MRHLIASLVLASFWATHLVAQDDTPDPSVQEETAQEENDKTRLENWLQDTLSGAGREVTVTGFQGALSNEATMQRLEISDDDGVWLRLSDIVLDWNRSAVLGGRFEITELTAAEIELSRLPGSAADEDEVELPSTQASEFTLPELPVSVNIGTISADSLILGEAILGTRAEMRLEGSAQLANGEGEAEFGLVRVDGQEGEFGLAGSFSNQTGLLDLNVILSEGQGGIAASILGLPGEPALDLVVEGSDPISDFTANLVLATQGEDRLAGQVRLNVDRAAPEDETVRSQTRITANLAGDLRPLFEAPYQPFFGGESLLHLEAVRFPNGATQVGDLFLRTDALELRGSAAITPEGWPERATLTGSLNSPDGNPVTLPISGPVATLAGMDLSFDYDVARGEGWTGQLDARHFTRDGTTIGNVVVSGAGTLEPGGGDTQPSVNGDVTLSVGDFVPRDAALAEAIGPQLSGSLSFAKADETPISITNIALSGADYRLTGAVTLDTVVEQLDLLADLDLEFTADDLSRFSAISGQDLAGAANVGLSGQVAVPGGPFDIRISGTTRDFDLGIAQLDGLFAGTNRIDLAVDRNAERTRISRAELTGPGVTARASGTLTEDGSQITAQLDLPDGTRLDPQLQGRVTVDATAVQAAGDWTVEGTATGPGNLSATFDATAQSTRRGLGPMTAQVVAQAENFAPYSGLAGRPLSGAANLTARIKGNLLTQAYAITLDAETRGLSAALGTLDRLIAGNGTLSLAARQGEDGTLFIDRLNLAYPLVTATATGSGQDGTNQVSFDARLADISVLVPNLEGAFSASGKATLTGDAYRLDVSGSGPAGMTLDVAGTVAGDASSADLSINGLAPLALANGFTSPNELSGMARFDLGLNGPLALTSLSGNVTSQDARVTLPNLRIALGPIRTNVSIGNGRARVEAQGVVSSGGQVAVSGPVSLSDGYSADLVMQLQNVGLNDPALYDTSVSGQVTVTGPLTGGARIAGRIEAGAVEIRIPTSGFGIAGELDGLTHVNEPAAVRQTRARANKLDEGGNGGTGPAYDLDLTVVASNQVFIRGRGLDAELGGQIRLTGTTANIVPIGRFSLIRGRLSLLGNRIDLSEASATLQGDFSPFIRVVATTQVDDVSIQIVVAGPATSPEVTFLSTPDLPEDEILSLLIFGRSVADISPLQALRLANGVATLSGRSGGGVMGSIREGFALSDLDVAQDEDGTFGVRAGAYVTENVYTGVEVGADGDAEVTINLDLNQNLTARGSLGTDGDTSLGIYFEKDY